MDYATEKAYHQLKLHKAKTGHSFMSKVYALCPFTNEDIPSLVALFPESLPTPLYVVFKTSAESPKA
jgi:hypothetical protein